MDEAKAGKVATLPSSAFTSSKLDGATQTNAVDKVQDVVTVSWPDGTERQIQISPETKKRLDKLFNEIDLDKDGKIDIADLETALNKRGHTSKSKNHAREFLQRSDTNQSGDVNFSEFIEYCLEHEKRLQVIFKDIDVNQDGKLDDVEIMDAFKKLGIAIDKDEANKLIQKMNKDGTLSITFEEWRDYLILYPAEEIRDLMRFWKHSFVLDFGDDSGVVPDDFTAKEMHTGMWWRHLIAGGVAGAVSRTCTAPLDRLKVFLQVRGTEFGSLSICLETYVARRRILFSLAREWNKCA
ncbi:Calcium-binding mitochondrial carrier protein SCaMC-2 [Halotydeus destructor]|nr:Calcium-binding mitochondrial carrier protein SCaMC-2 [Halotydeus destructor]